jgi:hypothetical protein
VKEIDFQHKLDKKIKDLYKKMKAKKLRDEEKARKAADKAARKAATDAKRVANRRAKRIREREEAAAAAEEAGEDNTGGLEEEVRLLFVRVLHSDITNIDVVTCSQSTAGSWTPPIFHNNLLVPELLAPDQSADLRLNLLRRGPI